MPAQPPLQCPQLFLEHVMASLYTVSLESYMFFVKPAPNTRPGRVASVLACGRKFACIVANPVVLSKQLAPSPDLARI